MIQTRIERPEGGKALAVGLLLLAALMAAMVVLDANPAHAATFTVNSTGDTGDNTPDGACLNCTLRQAIQEANAAAGADVINFNIPGSGVKTISPTSALPSVTEQVTIDGYTQPGASENTLKKGTDAVLRIELNGSNAGFVFGLDILNANGVVIRGLAINRFERIGIKASGAGHTVEGNFVGTDPSGTIDRGNGERAGEAGMSLGGADDSTVGGASPEDRNLISGNGGSGVEVHSSSGNKVKGNLIGTDKNGTNPLGNSGSGVEVGSQGDTTDTIVGDGDPGDGIANAANTIAFNGEDGVVVKLAGSTGNRILSNSMFSNGELGIDLQGGTENTTGATKNDPADADIGPNNLQNKPVLISAVTSGSTTTIEGKLNSTPEKTFTLQFFSNPSGNEGKTFIAQRRVSTNVNGNAPFTFGFGAEVPAGQKITATATRLGNTSEFSAPRAVVAR